MTPDTIAIAFAHFETAREVIERLENAGLEGATMRFEEPDREAADAASPADEQDGRMMGRALRNLSAGAAIGTVAGAVLGFLAGMAMFPDGPLAGVVAVAFGAGAAGTGVGVAVAGIARHKQSEAWADTFEAPDRPATLHVTVSTDEERDLVLGVATDAGGRVLDDAT